MKSYKRLTTHNIILRFILCISIILIGWVILRAYRTLNSATIHPSLFTTTVNNPYFSLPKGRTFVYYGQTDEGYENNEIEITGETYRIMGIETLVYHDRAWLNGELIEDTRDYIAQHKQTGDVWYFGEHVDNYKNGKLVNHSGSWIAGENGAKPGIWVKAHPTIGEEYQQEYYPGEAEDMVTVISLDETVSVPYGTFTHCLQTKDWTPLDPASLEYKYYCPETKTVTLEVDIPTQERVELVDIESTN